MQQFRADSLAKEMLAKVLEIEKILHEIMGKCLCLFWTKDFCEAQSGGKSILNRLCTDQAKKQISCIGLGKQRAEMAWICLRL